MRLIEPAQYSQLRAAAQVFRNLYDDGYIDWSVDGQPNLSGLADQIDAMLSTYGDCLKAPAVKLASYPTVTIGKFCPACQAIPAAGHCGLAGCPRAPTK